MTSLLTSKLGLAAILMLSFAPMLHARSAPIVRVPVAQVPDVQAPYRPGELLVKFKPGAVASAAHASTRSQRLSRFGRLEHVRLAAGMDVEGMRRWYQRQADVEYAEPNYIVRKAATPNDTHFEVQWALRNTGQGVNGTFGMAGADINASLAWDRHTGNGAVVVAVLDTGIDYLHPELAANIWRNPGEVANDGIDNDGNGKVDDIRGWNFISNNADPMDDDVDGGHGSHVAGIVGAVGNNANGISGINWNIKLMPLKVLSDEGSGDLASVIAGIDYAIAMGAKVINASYAFDCGVAPSISERDAYDRARAQGILVTLAAGNDSCDNDVTPSYPANHALNNMLSVGASDQFDTLAVFSRIPFNVTASNFGAQTVHLFAPGKNIYGTLRNDRYGFQSGTSMASPHVAGAAALLKSYRPALDMFQVREILLKTSQPKTALADLAVTSGRLDVGAAIDFDLTTSTPMHPSHLVAEKVNDSQIEVTWLDDSTIETGWKLEYRNHPAASFTTRASLAAGSSEYLDVAVQAGEGTYNGYRVRAFNGVGDSLPTAEVKLITPPLAPDNLRASGQGGTLSLTWIDRSGRETGYRLERGVQSGLFNEIANLAANTTRFEDSGLTLGTQYRYRVRAESAAAGFSVYSSELLITPQAASEGGGGGGGCFIATAAYGSALHPKVNTLRQLRDRYLLPNSIGRAFVDVYYRASPPLADFISRHEWLRAGVRTLLWPLVWLAEAIVPEARAGAFLRPAETTPAEAERVDARLDVIAAEIANEHAKEKAAERQLLVKFAPAVGTPTARAALQAVGALRVETVSAQLYLAEFADQAKRTQAAQALMQAGQVEYVEANRVVKRPLTR